jgi:hypothetical protein
MKADAYQRAFTVSPAWAKGICPICAVLKECQSDLADQVQIAADVTLCNFHTRLLARGAPAKNVAAFHLKVLGRSPIAKVASSECDFCRWILQEENARLRELVKQMQRTLFLDWMKSQVSLCLDHEHKLEHCAPLKMQPVWKSSSTAAPSLSENWERFWSRWCGEITPAAEYSVVRLNF